MRKINYERGNRLDYTQKRFFPDFPLTLIRDMNSAKRKQFILETINRFLAENGRIELLNFAHVNAPGSDAYFEKGMDAVADFFVDLTDCETEKPSPEVAFCYNLGSLCKRMAIDRLFDLTLISNDIDTIKQPHLAIQPDNESLFLFIESTKNIDLAVFLAQTAFYWFRKMNPHQMNKPLAEFLQNSIDEFDRYLASGEMPKCEYIRQACRIASEIREHDQKMREFGLSPVAADILDSLSGCYYISDYDPDLIDAAPRIERLAKEIPHVGNSADIAAYLGHLISHDDIIIF